MRVQANGLSIEVEDSGPAGDRPPVLLVMGLGMQLIAWPQELVDALVRAGHRVVRFDNRDIGLSQRLDHLGVPNLLWESMKLRFGLPVRAPYTLADLAADAFGVLDALGIGQAHVVGASMGGMVAQRMALAAPGRVLTLTSIMSSSGARYLPGPQPRVLQVLLARPKDHSEPTVLAHYVRLFQAIGSPAYPSSDEELRQRIRASVRRGGYRPAGSARQLAAVAS
ncbi:MAG TPA: alpha/beta hydrolase family protein, partial [Ramlibacter sp.]